MVASSKLTLLFLKKFSSYVSFIPKIYGLIVSIKLYKSFGKTDTI